MAEAWRFLLGSWLCLSGIVRSIGSGSPEVGEAEPIRRCGPQVLLPALRGGSQSVWAHGCIAVDMVEEPLGKGDVTIDVLVTALTSGWTSSTSPLQKVEFGFNGLGTADHARSVATLLTAKALPRLAELSYVGNTVPAIGARAIARALQENKSLRKLNLWSANLGDDGVAALAEGVHRSQLAEIDVRNNFLTDNGATSLLKAVISGGTITKVRIRSRQNRLSESTIAALEAATAANARPHSEDL